MTIYFVNVPRPLVTVSTADILVLHFAEVVHFHRESRLSISLVFVVYSVNVPRPLVTISTADIPVLRSIEVVHFHYKS